MGNNESTPGAPYLRRLFRPGEFRYLVFDAIYCRRGREEVLTDLFESVCAAEGFNTGLMWLDDRSTLYDKIRTSGKMGPLTGCSMRNRVWSSQNSSICQMKRKIAFMMFRHIFPASILPDH